MKNQISILFYLTSVITFFSIGCKTKDQKYLTISPVSNYLEATNEFPFLDRISDPNHLIAFLDNSSELESERVGFEGRLTQSFQIYKRLALISSDTTLVRQTTDKNPKMRVYGMGALTNRNKTLALRQLKLLKHDDALVVYNSGCTRNAEKVCWLITANFHSSEVALKQKENAKHLDLEVIIK